MIKTTIVSGSYSVRGFEDDGVHYGAEPIKEFENFEISNVIANKVYTWDFSVIKRDVIPITLFCFKNTGIYDNDDLTITVRNASNNQLIWKLNIDNKKEVLGNIYYFTFPFLVISKSQIASIVSNVDLDYFVIFGRVAHLNKTTHPTLII